MLTELMKQVDEFCEKYGPKVEGRINPKFKSDLMEVVQKAIDLGEGKDQNKISGILVKGIKAFMGGKD